MIDMHRSGFISDSSMKKFDKMCLDKKPETAYEKAPTRKVAAHG